MVTDDTPPATIPRTSLLEFRLRQIHETPAFAPLLINLDPTSALITADDLDTKQVHACQIVAAGCNYLFSIKGNQPTLLRQLKAPGLPLPYTLQVIQVARCSTDRKRG